MFGGTFRMPWHGYLMLSLAVAAFAVWMHSDLVRVEQEKKAALAQPAPAPVTLAAFRKDTDIHLAGEVNVIGWPNPDFNSYLVKGGGGEHGERLMFVLFDGGDSENAGVARAAILVPSALEQGFRNWLSAAGAQRDAVRARFDNGFGRQVYVFNGRVDPQPKLADLAMAALAEAGLVPAPEFIFIEPFLEGRQAALAADPATTMQLTAVVGAVSMVLLFAAISNFDRSRATDRLDTEAEELEPDVDSTRAQFFADARVPELPELEEAPDTSVTGRQAVAASWLRSPVLLIVLGLLGIASASGASPRLIALSLIPALGIAAALWAVMRAIGAALQAAREGRIVTRSGLFGERKVFEEEGNPDTMMAGPGETGSAEPVSSPEGSHRTAEASVRPLGRRATEALGINATDVRRTSKDDPAGQLRRHPQNA